MAKQITCECGFVARADSDAAVIDKAREHIRADHPDLVGKVSQAELQSWVQEVGAPGKPAAH